MSISNSYPTQRPSLNLVFNGGSDQLDSRISFTRADTPPTYAAPSAVHYWSNEKHLSSLNLLSQSGSIDGSGWSSSSVSRSQSGTFLNGSNAFVITETATTAAHYFQAASSNYFSTISGESYTVTLFAKSGTVDGLQIVFGSGQFGTNAYANFDLSNASTSPVTGSSATASITALGSDWVKCVITSTATGTGTSATSFALTNNDINAARFSSYAGSASSNIAVGQCNISSTGETVLNETSGSIHREYSSTLKSVANSGDPRFEYSPTDGQSVGSGTALGLKIEAQATNLATASEEVNNWNPVDATVQQNVAISPAGTLTACKLTENGDAASTHYIYKSVPLGVSVGSTVYTISFFAKADGRTEINSYDNNQTTGGSIRVDLTSGAITSGSGKVDDCGNGWYRISYQATADFSTSAAVRIFMRSGGTGSYDGDSYSGVLLWGMQVEIGSAPTSYIKTTTSATATRSADSCSVALSDVGIANGQDLTLVVEGDYGDPAIGANDRIAATLGHDSSNWVYIANRSGKAAGYIAREGGTNQADNTGTVTAGKFKSAVRVAPNNYGQAINGGAAVTDTSGSVPLYDTLSLGKYWNQAYELNGTLSRVSIYSEPLSDTNLTALTSS